MCRRPPRGTRRNRIPWWCVFIVPCAWPFFLYEAAKSTTQGTYDLTRSAYKGTKKRISRARRQRTNRHAATHDVAARNSMLKVTERNLQKSPFLKLPMEIRQLIYDLHLGFHLEDAEILIRELNDGGYKLCAAVNAPSYIQGPMRKRFNQASPVVREPNQLLRLALVSRQVYCEFIEQIYKRTTFSLGIHEALLLPTLGIFPQKHLDSLRSLQLKFCIDILVKDLELPRSKPDTYDERSVTSWRDSFTSKSRQRRRWAALWELLASLPKLDKLRVTFTRLPGPSSPDDTAVFWLILAPLLRFNQGERLALFEVEWQRNTKDWQLSDETVQTIPFEIVWIPAGRVVKRYRSQAADT